MDEPQSPFGQAPVQHSDGVIQGNPSILQACVPQTPPSHTPEQHWLGVLHAKPSAVHISKPQVLLCGLQNCVQQSPFVAHIVPSGKHPPPHV